MAQPFLVMGIVNVTPDSFSDGGRYLRHEDAIAHGRRLVEEGADLVDVGGESTRPGATPVEAAEEIARVEPVVRALSRSVRVSIDTTKVAVAEAALRAGASYVNDVSAFRFEPEMAGLVADADVECCLMHMRGNPRTMQDDPRYDDVVDDVKAHLEERMAFAIAEGVREERIHLDPGIGFGKTLEHNLELLRRLPELLELGRPVLIGTSRKSFIGALTGRPVDQRLPGTIASNVLAYLGGARLFRVHDVAAVRDALTVAAATVPSPWSPTTMSTATISTTPTTSTVTTMPSTPSSASRSPGSRSTRTTE
jgi:dihydropteroate synthase